MLPGDRIEPLVPKKLGSPASTDASPSRLWGLLFDIVKMEERETWTARFLRSDREIGQTDFDGTFSQEVHYQSRELRFVVTGVCPRQFASQDASANVQTSTKSVYQT